MSRQERSQPSRSLHCLIAATAAWAAETLEVTASFSPDKLGAPTNVHGTATIGSTSGPLPSPIAEATVMGPAGLTVDTKGVGICNAVKLEQTLETSVCPKDSKAGFGGGMGAYEIAGEVNEEPFTLNFYRGPDEDGHLVILAYLNAVSPDIGAAGAQSTGRQRAQALRAGLQLQGATDRNPPRGIQCDREEHLHHARRAQRRLLREGGRQAQAGARQGHRRPQDLPQGRLPLRDPVPLRGRHDQHGQEHDSLPARSRGADVPFQAPLGARRGRAARTRGRAAGGRGGILHPQFNPPPAREATTATIHASFSPDRLGAKAAFTFAVHFGGGELDVPSPVRKAVVRFPAGLTLDVPKLESCSKPQLQARGPRACPAQSVIGTGRALADVHVGSTVESEEAAISVFVGPPQGPNPTIEILGQGYSPLEERVVITATALPDNPPYGEKLVMSVPAIPTIPLEPNASRSPLP